MKIYEMINVGSTDIGKFTEEINKLIVKGWQPYGNVFMEGNLYTILMARY